MPKKPFSGSPTQSLSAPERSALLLPTAEAKPVPPAAQTGVLTRNLRSISFAERRALLLLGDTMIIGGLYAAITAVFLLKPAPAAGFFGVLVTLLYLGAMWMLDLYQPTPYRFSPSNSLRTLAVAHFKSVAPLLARAIMLATLLVGTLSFFRANWFPVQPKALVVLAAGACIALYAWRLIFFRLFHMTLGKKRALVVGAGLTAQDLVLVNRQYPHLGYELVGFTDDNPALWNTRRLDLPVLGSCTMLSQLIQRHECDTVFIGITGPKSAATVEALADCLAAGVEILTVADLYEGNFGIVPLRSINHAWFVYNLANIHRGLYVNIKRLIDIVCAGLGLFAASPLLLVLALAVRLDSPGPVFYSQIRVGERGRHFRIYKLRSMRTNAEANGAMWAQKDDPRITRLGKFMRKTRLDELPQLINVLRGDLSLVGPRPERPEFVEELKQQVPYYDRRHMVKPGLTGWAQVRFAYGASVHDSFEKLQYDFYYLKNRSLVLDLEIILRTVWVVLMQKGAQ